MSSINTNTNPTGLQGKQETYASVARGNPRRELDSASANVETETKREPEVQVEQPPTVAPKPPSGRKNKPTKRSQQKDDALAKKKAEKQIRRENAPPRPDHGGKKGAQPKKGSKSNKSSARDLQNAIDLMKEQIQAEADVKAMVDDGIAPTPELQLEALVAKQKNGGILTKDEISRMKFLLDNEEAACKLVDRFELQLHREMSKQKDITLNHDYVRRAELEHPEELYKEMIFTKLKSTPQLCYDYITPSRKFWILCTIAFGILSLLFVPPDYVVKHRVGFCMEKGPDGRMLPFDNCDLLEINFWFFLFFPVFCGIVFFARLVYRRLIFSWTHKPRKFPLKAIVVAGRRLPVLNVDMRTEAQRVTPVTLDARKGVMTYHQPVPLPYISYYDRSKITCDGDNNIIFKKYIIGLRRDGVDYYFNDSAIKNRSCLISAEKYLQLIQLRNISAVKSVKLNHEVLRQRAGNMPGINIDKYDVALYNIEENTLAAATLFAKSQKLTPEGQMMISMVEEDGTWHPLA